MHFERAPVVSDVALERHVERPSLRRANTAQFIVGVSARRSGTVRSMAERLRSESRRAPGNTAAPSACNGRDMTSGSPAFRLLKVYVCRTARTAVLSSL